ncbi:MAG: hypothetical protein J6Q51_03360 [Clostridia bacterium]|nr:hypothetical protein [Clostridia bacterium]
MEEKEMPKLEEIQEEEIETKPNIEEGLRAIINSNDIYEIKVIAKSLLGEEAEEEKETEDVTMADYLGGK